MSIFRKGIAWCILLLCFTAVGCGPVKDLLGKGKKSKGSGDPFRVAVLATTGEVSSQSTQPLKLWYGGIANVTTDRLVVDKLIFRLETNMTSDELRARNARGQMRYGDRFRTAEVQVNEDGTHELQFLALNARHAGLEGELVPPQTVEDLKNLGPETRILTADLFLSGQPHEEEGTQVQLTLVQVDTMPQTQGGKLRLAPEENQPIKWEKSTRGYAVLWKEPGE